MHPTDMLEGTVEERTEQTHLKVGGNVSHLYARENCGRKNWTELVTGGW